MPAGPSRVALFRRLDTHGIASPLERSQGTLHQNQWSLIEERRSPPRKGARQFISPNATIRGSILRRDNICGSTTSRLLVLLACWAFLNSPLISEPSRRAAPLEKRTAQMQLPGSDHRKRHELRRLGPFIPAKVLRYLVEGSA